jgi:Putative DNA-binding domain
MLGKLITAAIDLPPLGTSRESGTFDFKGEQDPDDQRELAKDIAAFANALGGTVLVGAVEDRRRATLGCYKPIQRLEDAEKLKRAYELAITQRCVPQPVAEVVRIETDPTVHPTGHVVAVNVYAAANAPIGVRWDQSGSQSFAFPLRTATQAYFMPPTEIAMLMVPQVRRVAVLLEKIPQNERSDMEIQHSTPQGAPLSFTANFRGIDDDLTTATFGSTSGPLATSTIPLDKITAVWRRDDRHWYISVDGFLSGSAVSWIYRPVR